MTENVDRYMAVGEETGKNTLISNMESNMDGSTEIADNQGDVPETVAEVDEEMDDTEVNTLDNTGLSAATSLNGSDDVTARVRMLSRVAMSEAHFKHQQLGEPDLTLEEKILIAQELLNTNKVVFLAKFGNYLELEDVEYFKNSRDIYEVNFYCKQIEKSKTGNFGKNVVKNRRYEAMKELMMEGEYFSDDEMKFRDPYLYDQMVGQFLTDDEIKGKVDKSDLTFSSILIKHMDILDENKRFEEDKDVEEGQAEEEEESDEEEQEDEELCKTDPLNPKDKEEDEEKPKISDERRQELKEEFLTIMQERFMGGEDKQFDYSKVDANERYDNLTMMNIDAEERYFDDEDPESVHSDSNL